MDPKLTETAASVVLSALAGYLLGMAKTRRTLAVDYDKDLRKRRLVAYKAIWRSLEPFALYSPSIDFAYDDIEALSRRMRDWYFTTGGLLLSTEARDQYFDLQDDIVKILRAKKEAQSIADMKNGGSGNPHTLRDKDLLLTRMEAEQETPKQWNPGRCANEDYLHLRDVASKLRTRLSDDLGTRRPPLLGRRSRRS
jgi:hypothetical protein